MKAVLFRRFGGTDVLEWTETENPQPKRGEICVRVRASSINPFECEIREGAFKMLTGRRFPMIAGHDIAGEVEALGEGSSRFRIGDRVFAMRKAFSSGAQGIIHRDLKPSNILVAVAEVAKTSEDRNFSQVPLPIPKVIDFGVAKATQQERLTDLTLAMQYRRLRQMIISKL